MKISLFGFLLLAGFAAHAQEPQLVGTSIHNAFIPAGFDSNDQAQIVVEGTLGGDCNKIGPTEVRVDKNKMKIAIMQKVYHYGSDCHFILVTYSKPVDLGILEPGEYQVVDGENEKVLGKLPIKKATSNSADDYLYAPLNDVTFLAAKRQVVVQGNFNNSCMRMKNVVSKMDGDHVVVILPIAEILDPADTCVSGQFPFSQKVKVPSSFVDGEHYLIHARSLDGQAINQTVNLPYF